MNAKQRSEDDAQHATPPLKEEKQSTYDCPACSNKLRQGIEIRHGGVHWYVIWCGVGRCPSTASNDGGTGATIGEAFADLEKKIEAEVERDDD